VLDGEKDEIESLSGDGNFAGIYFSPTFVIFTETEIK